MDGLLTHGLIRSHAMWFHDFERCFSFHGKSQHEAESWELLRVGWNIANDIDNNLFQLCGFIAATITPLYFASRK